MAHMELATWLRGGDALGELDAAHDAAWNAADSDLLALCRDRIAILLRHEPTLSQLTSERRAVLASWHVHASLNDTERAALAFTEQYVVDVTAVTEQHTESLREQLGDEGVVTFVNALLVIEQRMTLELGLDAVLGDRSPA